MDGDLTAVRAGRPAGASVASPSTEARVRPDPGLGPRGHRPGGGVRLRGDAGLPRTAGGRCPHDPRQLQPGDDHDRSLDRRRGLPRTAHGPGDRGGHRAGEARGPAGRPRRPDRAQPRDGAGRGRGPGAPRRPPPGHAARGHQDGGRPRGLPRPARPDRAALCALVHRGGRRRRGPARLGRGGAANHRPARQSSGPRGPGRTVAASSKTGEAYWERVHAGLRSGPIRQVIVERCVESTGRRSARGHARPGTCITVCSMANVDPLGIPRRLDRGRAGPAPDRHSPPAARSAPPSPIIRCWAWRAAATSSSRRTRARGRSRRWAGGWPAPGPGVRLGQGAGVLHRQAEGRGPVGRTVHAVHGRGHRHRGGPARGDGQGADGRVAIPPRAGEGEPPLALLSIADRDKWGLVELARALVRAGYRLAATGGTRTSLERAGFGDLVAGRQAGRGPRWATRSASWS